MVGPGIRHLRRRRRGRNSRGGRDDLSIAAPGAAPGTLPIAQPTRFDLIINVKTAKTLGLTVPPAILLRADQVLQ